MSIGELARSAGVPISTLRFYERRGLLQPASRSRKGYRRYVERDIALVRFLRRAQELGFRLSELEELLRLSEGRELARDEMERLGRSKLAEIENRIDDLRKVATVSANHDAEIPRERIEQLARSADVAGHGGRQAMPDAWKQGEHLLPLSYTFSPGADDDGITVHVPLALLPQIKPVGFEWLVPGLRQELVTALVRSLPKERWIMKGWRTSSIGRTSRRNRPNRPAVKLSESRSRERSACSQ